MAVSFFLLTDLRALEDPVSTFSPSSLTNQSEPSVFVMVEDNQFQIEQRQQKERRRERKRVMEEGRENDWTREMGGEEEGWRMVYVCVWSPLTSAE